MSRMLVVASREVRERSSILAAAAIAGVCPPVLKLWLGRGWAEDIHTLTLALIVAFPLATGLALGSSVLGRDIAERRLGFYFARPLSGLAIWAGKMAAAVGVVFVVGLLVSAPAYFASDEGSLLRQVPFGRIAVALGWIPLVTVVVAHLAASLYRSRSGLLPFDMAAFVVVLAAYAFVTVTLLDAGAPGPLIVAAPCLLALALGAVVIAGAAQVLVGRTDTRRGHLVLSSTLWGTLLAGALALGIFAGWVLAAPSATAMSTGSFLATAPDGDAAIVSSGRGGRAFYRPVFLVRVDTGGVTRIGGADTLTSPVFTPDGRRVVWMEHPEWRGAPRLIMARLAGPDIHVTRAPVPGAPGWPMALSADGARLLVSRKGRVAVIDTTSGSTLAEAAVENPVAASFLAGNAVRVCRRQYDPQALQSTFIVLDWTLGPGGGFTERVRSVSAHSVILRDVRASRFLVEESPRAGTATLAVYDAESGGRETVDLAGARDIRFARWLHDGRIAVATATDGLERLRLFDGARVAVDVDPGMPVYFAGEAGPTLVLRATDIRANSRSALFLDTTSGTLRRDTTLVPNWSYFRDLGPRPSPGSLAGRLFLSDAGLILMDPATGEKRVVVAR
jgi:hypothetical protein